MSKHVRAALLAPIFAVALLPLVPPGARAQDAAPLSDDQAKSLGHALSLWSGGLTAPRDGKPSYTVTPEGGHYRIEIPISGELGNSGVRLEGSPMTGAAKPLEGGRWALDDFTLPNSLRLIGPAGTPDAPASELDAIGMSLSMAQRDSHVVIDPTLATASTFDGSNSGTHVSVTIPKTKDFSASTFVVDVAHATGHRIWEPIGNSRVDVTAASQADGVVYTIHGKNSVKIAINSLHNESHATGVAPERVADVMTAVLDLLKTIPKQTTKTAAAPKPATPVPASPGAGAPSTAPSTTPGKTPDAMAAALPKVPDHPTPEQRVALHAIIDALRGLDSGSTQTLTAEGVSIDSDGHPVTIQKFSVGQTLSDTNDKGDVRMRIVMDGLDSPMIPPGTMHDFLPHHVVLAPHVSGFPVSKIFDMAGKLIDSDNPKPDMLAPDAMGLLASGPLKMGFDELAFDLGPATLKADGAVTVAGPDPQDVSGAANIQATNFNALIQRANTDPMLKQAGPVLIFLKGIGDEQNGVVTWKVTYADNKVMVNGTDMSQLIPHK